MDERHAFEAGMGSGGFGLGSLADASLACSTVETRT